MAKYIIAVLGVLEKVKRKSTKRTKRASHWIMKKSITSSIEKLSSSDVSNINEEEDAT